MADRVFERVLQQTAAQTAAALEAEDPEARRRAAQASEEQALRKLSTGMTAADAIQRILLAHRDRDYFRLLELPLPEVDALGRPTWPVTAGEVSKAYRRLSILVHPDKNPGEDARAAFEALNEAHRTLKDANKLEGLLKEHLEAAQRRADETLATATLDERVVLLAAQKQQALVLRKAQAESFQSEVAAKMRERAEVAKRKREAAQQSKYRRRDEEEERPEADEEEEQQQEPQPQQDGSEDEEDAAARRRALAKRRQKQRKPSGM